ncbi:MAG: alternative ribosome rescue aminoacyl-tRNA hydrolase ArfB [candidate division KSB1 bacterium]|nr:alternative ribosome rescue aminoacyl-tRNA hydrolase ArfB [candidate division KSB1 bacterium]MDZ7334493.1 alternative ribosome rescue aminoacyl-tRNA hydrolase ArfB [candidate division KSB1 bacterium]MDZ7357960.1 alternative ribosome rescue aminoacyl-tRNA hydrolase ArfB [candidate division KSB1 bacterium]MDZ7376940.1 alternative ribosome rescue aminoacyl-tRNA hydrolase ArfB [candidate division KSB1 bacterium]MDZ7400998.1 alternative ribosome rescue aminoacyl-tRNA hydrolase ArfB [candidate div
MIQITEHIKISEDEIREEFIRSSGPGGQNVNKVATAVQLRFDVQNSPSLPEEVKERLIKLAGNRITEDGELIITAKRFRTQGKNREDALQRLIELLSKASQKPKVRRRRKISLISKYRRLEEKRKISEKKKQRRFSQREAD